MINQDIKHPSVLLNENQDIKENYILHLNFLHDVTFEPEFDRREDILIQINPNNFQRDYSELPKFIRKLF